MATDLGVTSGGPGSDQAGWRRWPPRSGRKRLGVLLHLLAFVPSRPEQADLEPRHSARRQACRRAVNEMSVGAL